MGIKGYRLNLDQDFDENWRLSILSYPPFADYFHLGIPKSIRHKPESKPYAVLEYYGDISLETHILRDLIVPKDMGNGLIVITKDRIPKYLQRNWGLGAK